MVARRRSDNRSPFRANLQKVKVFLWAIVLLYVYVVIHHVYFTPFKEDEEYNALFDRTDDLLAFQHKDNKDRNHVVQALAMKRVPERPLPAMSTGGVIFYLHVPTTGGTSIRQTFSLAENVYYVPAHKWGDFHQAVDKIDYYLSKDYYANVARKPVFIEVHGWDNYNMLELRPYLKAWRELSQRTGVPFFAFSLLRDPVEAQLSFFNYYHIRGDPRFKGVHTRAKKEQEKAMLELAYENPQCLFLSRGERTFGDDVPASARANLTKTECFNVYEALQGSMDWVGTTKGLSNETLPILAHMLHGNANLGRNRERRKKAPPQGLKASDLDRDTLRELYQKSELDLDMYKRATRDFEVGMWTDFDV